MQVTTIIPVHGCLSYLGEAVESALAQTDVSHEIIVVEDGPPDGARARDLLADFASAQVRLIEQDHGGTSVARNKGVAAANGDVIAFLDADDLWEPQKLSLQLAALAEGHGQIIFCGMEEFISPDIASDRAQTLKPRQFPKAISPTTCLLRRVDFEKTGGFEASLFRGEFIEWFARAEKAGLIAYSCEEVLAHRRLHDYNTKQSQKERQAYAQLAAKLLAARRNGK
ncbi:MAG: glycosyltransferase family A protein [Pseudomonadota bacterium]